MTTSNHITPGMTLNLDGKIFRVESSVKVSVAKGVPFIKTKLRNLISEEIIEKNFKVGQEISEVSLVEHALEYLYPEEGEYIFLDIENLNQIKVSQEVLRDKVDYLKEGTPVRAMFYGETIFSIELPQFLELMVVKTESDQGEGVLVANNTKKATLETGAKIEVPLFVESGDIVKVDTLEGEYIQRV